ncbi:hypothetical protein GU926_11480 [Nibribacter ruber]|uniref:Uncharacterized protein n=1 Tax=Nibribacter ruber TaxID=2698458 RepID=A0A6P1NW05_9BACT|nr:hypothetical protein [Nibribacter ruber]QHL88016.1 hypothetical protein GU926_11480 [Nibribacter ruber]
MMKKLFFLILVAWAATQTARAQDMGQRYFIELMTGERIYAHKIQFKSPLFKQNYFLLDDSLQYTPDRVRYFQNQEGYFARLNTTGRRFGDFAQRESAGKISTYFVYRTDYNYSPGVGVGMGGVGMGGYGYGYPTQRRVYYFSKENGPLEPLSYKNLRVALSDNPGSMESLQKYKRGQNIQLGMYIAGGGLMLAGLQQQFRSTPEGGSKISPLFFVGLGVSLLPQVIRLVKKDQLSEAIELYNYTPVN